MLVVLAPRQWLRRKPGWPALKNSCTLPCLGHPVWHPTTALISLIAFAASAVPGSPQQTPASGPPPASGSAPTNPTSASTAAAVPTAAPDHVLNVRDFGAVGDGVTLDRAAIQKAVDSAHPGDAIYFPAGTYALDDSIKVLTSQLTFTGDGPTSVLFEGWHRGFDLGIFGENLTGLVVQHLQFLGVPGKYMADNNRSPAIQIAGPQGTVVQDCDFVGVGNVVNDVRNTYGTQISNCRVKGWGEAAIFCNGGELVSNCQLVQDDPDLTGERSSHGFYIHSGAANVVIQDTTVRNCRKFAAQLYGEEENTTISNIRFLRCTFQNCADGVTIKQGRAGAARARDILIEDCTFRGIYRGPALAIMGGDQIRIERNLIENGRNAGIALGRWAPREGWGSIRDARLIGNTIRNCGAGIYGLASHGGRFVNVSLTNNHVSHCKVDVDLTGAPGVSVTSGP